MLTRVKKVWQQEKKDRALLCCVGEDLKDLHNIHHFRKERTLYLVNKVNPTITMESVQEVVKQCKECQSIDPVPTRVNEEGELHIIENWKRLAIDVTLYRHELYLTMIDCWPGRVAIWRKIRAETVKEIKRIFEEVFMERGPVEEVLMDNGTSFHSELLRELCEKWGVKQYLDPGIARVEHRKETIIERNHRIIKAVTERSRISQETVFWYNIAPKNGQDETSVSYKSVITYKWRQPLAWTGGGE